MVTFRSLLFYLMKDPFRAYAFVFCCAIVLVIAWLKRSQEMRLIRDRIVLPSLLILAAFVNPVATHFLMNSGLEETQVLRFTWLVPVTLTLSICITWFIDKLKKNIVRIVVSAGLTIIVLAYAGDWQQMRILWSGPKENLYNIPSAVLQLCDFIMQDDTYEEKRAVFPMPLNLWVRQYQPAIIMPFSWRSPDLSSDAALMIYYAFTPLEEGTPIDLERVAIEAVIGDYPYIVIAHEGNYAGSLESNGYDKILTIGDPMETNPYNQEYDLYRLAKESTS